MSDSAADRSPIGILGGTFDPVHIGHLRLAIEVLEALHLSTVRMIPLNQPNHQTVPVASAGHRLEMMSAAIDGAPIIADDRELQRGGISFTIDTLESLRADFAQHPLCLLVGADAFHNLCEWHRWRELLAYSHLVVVDRPDAGAALDPRLQQLVDTVTTVDPDILRHELYGRIYFQPIPPLPISSTDIRTRIAGGREIRYLVPSPVRRLIDRYQLYKGAV